MSHMPSSPDKGWAEHHEETSEGLGQTAGALDVLCCFDGTPRGGRFRPTYSTSEIARTIERPTEAVDRQIAQLIKLGFLERAPDDRFRLSERLLGTAEVVASSPSHSRTASRVRGEDRKGASSRT